MLISIQFPVADSRRFVHMSRGLLQCPTWPSPTPDKEFIRALGSIRRRKRGGTDGWVGESETCEANKAIRFTHNLGLAIPGSRPLKLRCQFRRFFCDGLALGKFEIGISVVYWTKRYAYHESGWNVYNPRTIAPAELIRHILSLPVEVRTHSGNWEACELGQAGQPLANLYRAASTKFSDYTPSTTENWQVRAGNPMLFWDHEQDFRWGETHTEFEQYLKRKTVL